MLILPFSPTKIKHRLVDLQPTNGNCLSNNVKTLIQFKVYFLMKHKQANSYTN